MVNASRLSFNLKALGESIHEVRQQNDSCSEDPFAVCTTAEVCDNTITISTGVVLISLLSHNFLTNCKCRNFLKIDLVPPCGVSCLQTGNKMSQSNI